MTTITRRSVVTGLAAAPVVAVPAVAAEPETPMHRVRRLALELQDALAEYDDGRWFAYVYPNDDYFSVMRRDERTQNMKGFWLGQKMV